MNWAFQARRHLTAFEFFSIVIWKANRAKSIIAKKLLKLDPTGTGDLKEIVRVMTSDVARYGTPRERLATLMSNWRLALPMASAVLTVLYPEEFSVYIGWSV